MHSCGIEVEPALLDDQDAEEGHGTHPSDADDDDEPGLEQSTNSVLVHNFLQVVLINNILRTVKKKSTSRYKRLAPHKISSNI